VSRDVSRLYVLCLLAHHAGINVNIATALVTCCAQAYKFRRGTEKPSRARQSVAMGTGTILKWGARANYTKYISIRNIHYIRRVWDGAPADKRFGAF